MKLREVTTQQEGCLTARGQQLWRKAPAPVESCYSQEIKPIYQQKFPSLFFYSRESNLFSKVKSFINKIVYGSV